MTDDKLNLLFQAAISDLENWRIFTSQITQPYLLYRRDLVIAYESVAASVATIGTVPSVDGLIHSIRERLTNSFNAGSAELETQEWVTLCKLIQQSRSVALSSQEISQWSGEYISELLRYELAEGLSEVPSTDLKQWLEKYTDSLGRATAAHQITDDDLNPMSESQISNRRKVINFTPTEISFIDKYIGGFAGREMYSYVGVTGGAKTSVAVQLATNFAVILDDRHRAGLRKKPLGKIYYVTTEDGMDKIFNRMVSCMGKVPLAKISGKSVEPKTTVVTSSARDKEICNQYFGGTLFGEVEREIMAQERITRNIRIIDLTKASIRATAADPLDVVRMMIDRSLESDKQKGLDSYCALVIIDHTADVILDKLAIGSRNDNLWTVTTQVPKKIRDEIAYRYECPVWVVHQSNGDGNRKKVGQVLDHTNAMGSGSWAMHFVACFNVNTLEAETMTCTLTCSKARENKKMGPTHLQLVGDIGTMTEVEKLKTDETEKKDKDVYKTKKKIINLKNKKSEDSDAQLLDN